jgi:cysteine-rich repeat protein
MRQMQSIQRLGRGAGRAAVLLALSLLAASGCSDEVGGDGYEPPRPTSGGALPAAGGAEGGAAGDRGTMGGKSGSGGTSGMGGKGGKGGTGGKGGSVINEGGAAGQTPGSTCGNSHLEDGEECDDGNTKSGDGCTADCKSGCEVCEKTYCKNVRAQEAGKFNWIAEFSPRSPNDIPTACYDMDGSAQHGPAQGVPRADLCQAMVDCVRREKCAQIVADDYFSPTANKYISSRYYVFMRCFCDRDVTDKTYVTDCSNPAPNPPSADPTQDPPHFIAGKCAREIQDASEVDNPGEAFKGLFTGGMPFGAANLLLQACDTKLCTEECLPAATAGAIAQISGDILQLKSAAGESPLGNLIADSQRAATATDFALVNEATYKSDYGPLGLFFDAAPGRPADADGRVLESEVRHVLFGMDPVGSAYNEESGGKLVTLSVTGQKLYDLLNTLLGAVQVSGLNYTWDASQPSGSKIVSITMGAAAIDKAATYSVTVNDFFAKSIVGGTNIVTTEKNPERELVAYLKAQVQPVAPPPLDRVTRLN